ncbi:MAG: OmpA family protein, partial [Lachnospiraceae bacterium]|nr:OmpA family protein [Lachnospiraceae bacterium]
YAENKEVLDTTAPSVFSDMCGIWESIGETVNRKAAMTLFDNQYILPLASKYSSNTSKPATVELTEEQKEAIIDYEALLTKSMTVEFVADTAQFKNPDEAYAIMDEFVSIAQTLDGAIIQVEGNINAKSYSDSGQALSLERAKAVAKYFIASGVDPNRVITVGNGNTAMVTDPSAADAYLNRRTDVFFKIVEE